jgi:hypothetical protein
MKSSLALKEIAVVVRTGSSTVLMEAEKAVKQKNDMVVNINLSTRKGMK